MLCSVTPSAIAAPAPDAPKPAVEPLPDLRTYRQKPASLPEPAPARARYWSAEVGFDTGVVRRPANGDGAHDSAGALVGAHVRVKVLKYLDARIMGRVESCPFSYDDGALGLPRGTHIDQDGPRRVYLAAAAEPTWSPVRRLDLFVGVGIGWGRTLASALHASGQQTLVVPERAAVLVELPLSLGLRYELIENWLVANLAANLAFVGAQSGQLLSPYRTPGKDGALVTVGGFPEVGTSWAALAGLGILL
jgi:hypothetical protein